MLKYTRATSVRAIINILEKLIEDEPLDGSPMSSPITIEKLAEVDSTRHTEINKGDEQYRTVSTFKDRAANLAQTIVEKKQVRPLYEKVPELNPETTYTYGDRQFVKTGEFRVPISMDIFLDQHEIAVLNPNRNVTPTHGPDEKRHILREV